MGMEAMVQAARAVTECDGLPRLEKLEFLQPIVIPAQDTIILRIAALVRGPQLVEVVLRTSTTQFNIDHFHGFCRFTPNSPRAVQDIDTKISNLVAVDIEKDIYQDLLFHAGRFRRIKAYHNIEARHCFVQLDEPQHQHWFSSYLPNEFVLGDPGFRDAMIHAIQACIPHAQLLPVGIDKITFYNNDFTAPFFMEAKEVSSNGTEFEYTLEVCDSTGMLREKWEGLTLRRVAEIKHADWPAALLLPYFQRRIEELIPSANITVALQHSVGDLHERNSRELMQQVVGEPAGIIKRPDGKPLTNTSHQVSASHQDRLTLAVASENIVSCDLEQDIKFDTPAQLIGDDSIALSRMIASSVQEADNKSVTRVWSAKECLKKAGASFDAPLILTSSHRDGWVVLATDRFKIASVFCKMKNEADDTCFSFLIEEKYARL
jgi:enediyne polyketide synthase